MRKLTTEQKIKAVLNSLLTDEERLKLQDIAKKIYGYNEEQFFQYMIECYDGLEFTVDALYSQTIEFIESYAD